MKRLLAIITLSTCASAAFPVDSLRAQTADATAAAPTNAAATTPAQPTIIRDPRTGQLFQQEYQTVDQPVTTWQRRIVERTVVTPTTVIENEQVPQTIYVPKTEYVLQTKLKGWWNPLADPTYAYEYVPVTSWVPQTQMVTRQVPKTKMVPRTEQVAVDEPVQTTQKVTHIVMKPLPASASTTASPYAAAAAISPRAYTFATNAPSTSGYGYHAYTPPVTFPTTRSQPLIASVPVLGQPRTQSWQAGTLLQAPVTGLRNIVRTATAPFNSQATYGAPTTVASLPAGYNARDLNQTGMPATVLR